MSDTNGQNSRSNIVQRVAGLPLVCSALQNVSSVYVVVKDRYPLLGFMADLSSLGLHVFTLTAKQQAGPLLESLRPQIDAVNHYANVGLDQMESSFPVLNQSAEEVLGHLKDGFYLTLDDAQMRLIEGLDVVLNRWEQLVDVIWDLLIALQNSSMGQVVTSSLDEVLTRTEEAVNHYLPMPPTMRQEFELRASLYEDDDDDNDEPGLWTRVRWLLLNLSLQLYHQALKLRAQLYRVIQTLEGAANTLGLTKLMDVVVKMLQNLMAFYMSQVKEIRGLRDMALGQLSDLVQTFLKLPPMPQIQALPAQVGEVVTSLRELSLVLIQLLINTTPLYSMLEQPTEQELLDYLNQEEPSGGPLTTHSSSNSLFLKAMDGRPRRRRSFYARRRGSTGHASDPSIPSTSVTPLAPTPAPLPANGRRGSVKRGSQPELDTLAPSPTNMIRRKSSAAEVLLAPIIQLVSQSQRAFEYLSSTPNEEEQSSED
ncbi:perilipin 6 [Alosa sapidissima]|uniref:perilipin 6 n=1 Tax=Alosa sapidissima TaxID=34773 RepID=UPI001C08DF65|nr:perilipin 6 [Alosa sapidissima]